MNEPRPSTDPAAHRLAAADLAAVLLLDPHGRITGASASARALWQAPEGGLIGEPFASLFAFEVVADGPEWFEAQWEVLRDATLDRTATLDAQPREGAPRAVQVRLERFSETVFLATVQPPAPAPTTAAGASGDGNAYQLVAEQGAAGFFDLDLIANRATYSRSWKKMLGYVDAELPDTLETWRELIHPDDSGAAPDQVGRKPAAGARPFSVEFRMRHRLGHWVWVQCVGVQVLNATGQLERVVGLNLDISERKEIEEASLANDERMETLGGGPLGAFDLDFTAKSFWFSPAWKKILGYRDDELADTLETLAAVLPADEIPGGVETWLLLLAPGQNTFVLAEELVGKDGQRVPVLLGAHRTLTRKRDLARVIGFICTAPTLTPRSAGDDGGLGGGLVQDAFAALAEGVLVTDAAGRILHANPSAARLLARKPDEIVGAAAADVFKLVHRESGRPGDDPCDRALGADQPLPLFSDHALVLGARPSPAADAASSSETTLPIVWTARASKDAENNPRGVVIVFRDPGEMSLTPEELVKANRFESLGLLAGGIAHDFNNLLATILAGVSLAKDNRNYSALEDCEKACLTAKGLTKQLLAFAKGGAGSQSVISPKEILQDAVKIAAAGSDAEITVNLAENVDPVRVDRAQILQVFQNLIVNALQAMPPKPHRAKLQLTAKNVALAAEQIPPLAEGNYVEIEVRDNGSGIAPENLQKIFDPFFTTKKHGTGLGLATVLSIVRKHGGQIAVDSVVGTGTAFTAFLPRADAPVEVQARRAPSLRFGTGRILFMDDDPKLSELTATMLESLDYKFDLAKNGEEAIQLYKRYLNIGRPYDVALLDITVIGGMGGEECFKALRDLDPEVRAIVSSGYDNEDMARRFLDMGFCGYLTKPYRVTDLGKVLKTVLG